MEQYQPNNQSKYNEAHLYKSIVNKNVGINLTKKINVQNEKYQMPIFNHNGHNEKHIKAKVMITPIKSKMASFLIGLGVFQE